MIFGMATAIFRPNCSIGEAEPEDWCEAPRETSLDEEFWDICRWRARLEGLAGSTGAVRGDREERLFRMNLHFSSLVIPEAEYRTPEPEVTFAA